MAPWDSHILVDFCPGPQLRLASGPNSLDGGGGGAFVFHKQVASDEGGALMQG